MKFDVVIGNPPYNRGIDIDFIDIAFNISKNQVCLIVPAKWQTADGEQSIASKMSYNEFRKSIVPYIKQIIFYPCCRDVFDIMQVDGLTILSIDKYIHDKVIIENKSMWINGLNTSEYRSIGNRETLWNIGNSIVNKVFTDNIERFKISEYNKNGRYAVWMNNKIPGGGLSTLESNKQVLFIGMDDIEDTQLYQLERTSAYTLVFSSDSLEECKNFVSWIGTKFVQFLFAINISKLSNTLTDWGFRFVPKPEEFNHKYTDNELYDKYKLDSKQIEFIENLVKCR